MEISLHPDLEQFVREQVSRGEYHSPGEVVTEALFLLFLRDQAAGEDGKATEPPSPRPGPRLCPHDLQRP